MTEHPQTKQLEIATVLFTRKVISSSICVARVPVLPSTLWSCSSSGKSRGRKCKGILVSHGCRYFDPLFEYGFVSKAQVCFRVFKDETVQKVHMICGIKLVICLWTAALSVRSRKVIGYRKPDPWARLWRRFLLGRTRMLLHHFGARRASGCSRMKMPLG